MGGTARLGLHGLLLVTAARRAPPSAHTGLVILMMRASPQLSVGGVSGQEVGERGAQSRNVSGGTCSSLCPVSPPLTKEEGLPWVCGSCPYEQES